MIEEHLSRLILASTIAVVFLLSCSLFALLYKLDKLQHGDEIRAFYVIVIVCRITVAMVALSQLWLNDSTRYTIIPFLAGAVVLFYCLRVPFREVRKQDHWLYVSILMSLLFGSAACLALIYSFAYRIHNEKSYTWFFLRRFFLYGGSALVSLLLALRFYLRRQHQTAAAIDRPPIHLLQMTDMEAMVLVSSQHVTLMETTPQLRRIVNVQSVLNMLLLGHSFSGLVYLSD